MLLVYEFFWERELGERALQFPRSHFSVFFSNVISTTSYQCYQTVKQRQKLSTKNNKKRAVNIVSDYLPDIQGLLHWENFHSMMFFGEL